MLRLPLSLTSLLVAALLPASHALNWTSTRERPAFSDPNGEKVRGVNLGGWFVLENWMQSSLFAVPPLDQSFIADEWNYCAALGKDECSARLEEHFKTYITENDFREIAQRGLNTVRIPFPYWALVELEEWEPYVNASQMDYLHDGLRWAKKYGLDVMIDLHSVPGSQNGYDNSGLKGDVAWCSNTTNIDRSVDAVSRLTRAVTQPAFDGVVKAIEVLNEPALDSMLPGGCPFDTLADYYVRARNAVRAEEHVLDGAQPLMVVIHDAFQPVGNWEYFFSEPGLGGDWHDSFGLDTHIYQAFGDYPSFSHEQHLDQPCTRTQELARANANWTTLVGEFSLGTQTYCVAYEDCVGVPMSDNLDDLISPDQAAFTNHFWEAQRAVYEQAGGWVFWSWKTDAAPTWSFQQGMRQGWIPENMTNSLYSFDPSATEHCSTLKDDSTDLSFPTEYVGNSTLLANATLAIDRQTSSNTTASPGADSGTASTESDMDRLPVRGIGESSSETSGAIPSAGGVEPALRALVCLLAMTLASRL